MVRAAKGQCFGEPESHVIRLRYTLRVTRKHMESLLKRCTEPLLHVFANAAQRAMKEGKRTIEPSHLFFGLTHQEPPSDAQKQQRRTPSKKIAALTLSPQSTRLLDDAAHLAESYSHDAVGPEHLFASILYNPDPDIQHILKEHHVDQTAIKRQLVGIVNHTSKLLELLEILDHEALHARESGTHALGDRHHEHAPQKHPSALEFFTTELTNPAIAATKDPLIGRAEELSRLMRIIARRMKNNPVLVGPPGVGKTAIVEGLAKRIIAGDVPAYLKDRRIFALSLPTLLAGSAMRGDLEFRLSALIADIKKMPNAVLFIDELHNLVGAGGMHGSMDASEILKPELAHGTLHCIGATTQEEYKRWIEDDPALDRRFQSIAVAPPSPAETRRILDGVLEQYESFHKVTFAPEALDACVELSGRYLTETYFPDKALDVLDEAAAKVKVEERAEQTITPSIITDIIAGMTGIPPLLLAHDDTARILSLEDELKAHIVGQDNAVNVVARAIMRATAGLSQKGRPRASFLFLGPSGVGKTELARVLSRKLFGEGALLKFDMSEFSESHTVARLLGSPSGYIGYKEGGRLTEGVRRKPNAVILFDEAEKAHPRVLNILLQLLDDGRLTDMAGREVDFSNTIVILTSNIGSAHWQHTGGTLGFESANTATTVKRDRVIADVKQWLAPELLNRLDHVVTFDLLNTESLRSIAKHRLQELAERLARLNVTMRWRTPLLDAVMAKSNTGAHGARLIRHTIEETIEDTLAQELLRRKKDEPLTLTVTHGAKGFRCVQKAR